MGECQYKFALTVPNNKVCEPMPVAELATRRNENNSMIFAKPMPKGSEWSQDSWDKTVKDAEAHRMTLPRPVTDEAFEECNVTRRIAAREYRADVWGTRPVDNMSETWPMPRFGHAEDCNEME